MSGISYTTDEEREELIASLTSRLGRHERGIAILKGMLRHLNGGTRYPVAGDEMTPPKKKRGRRSKAQIEADEMTTNGNDKKK